MSDVKTFSDAVKNMNSATIAEQYVKTRYQRDQVVEAFNKLRDLNRQTTEDLLELRTLVSEYLTAKAQGDRTDDLIDALERIV